jgi:CelD/BcsL family acetyltransferase involved in cellulose biosynthesis
MWIYPTKATKRRFIELDAYGTWEDYFKAQFIGKTRGTKLRLQRKLKGACEGRLSLQCLEAPEDVPRCLKQLDVVRRRTWQGQVGEDYGLDTPDRIRFLADQGWLRCYFLDVGSDPIAYVIGRQHNGVFHYDQAGYSMEWRSYSPGTVLLMMMLEDIYRRVETPRLLDFGPGDARYKKDFSTRGDPEARLWAIRRTPATALAYGSFRLLELGLGAAKTTLGRLTDREKLGELSRKLRARAAQKRFSAHQERP